MPYQNNTTKKGATSTPTPTTTLLPVLSLLLLLAAPWGSARDHDHPRTVGVMMVDAAKSSGSSPYGGHGHNFRVVLDSAPGNDKNTRLMFKNKITKSPFSISPDNVKALVKQARKEFQEISKKSKALSKDVVDKFKENLQHYSKLELGFYAALTVALTVTLKTVVFSKASSKTLDLNKIGYILTYMSATVPYGPVKELEISSRTRRGKKVIPSIMVSPSIGSSDGKTYIKKLSQQKARTTTYPKKPKTGSLPPLPARPAQVVIDTVTAFYQENPLMESQGNHRRGVSASSHNAVIQNMTPAMRRSLKARRIRGGAVSSAILQRLEVGMYFGIWYALNAIYNIVNKKVLNVLPAPLIVGSIQFGTGALYCALVWLLRLRPYPRLTPAGKSAVAKVGAYHALGQLASMISLGAGPVSFTHIVKAMEPFFSALVSGLYFGKWMQPQVYATLIPVVCGVGYACMNELNFSWLAFAAAMASNVLFALRAVMSKLALQSGKAAGTNLTPPNMFGLVTVAAFVISLPIALIWEGRGFADLWTAALDQVENTSHFVRAIVLSGFFHYLNNEVMYLALGKVHPVTLAVGNVVKRVVILVSSIMVFRNPISFQAAIGSGVGISGVLLYSLTKQYYETLEAAAPKSAKKKRKVPGKK